MANDPALEALAKLLISNQRFAGAKMQGGAPPMTPPVTVQATPPYQPGAGFAPPSADRARYSQPALPPTPPSTVQAAPGAGMGSIFGSAIGQNLPPPVAPQQAPQQMPQQPQVQASALPPMPPPQQIGPSAPQGGDPWEALRRWLQPQPGALPDRYGQGQLIT